MPQVTQRASLLGSSAIYLGAAAVTALVPFASLPIFARLLGPEDLGIASVFLVLVNVFAVVVGVSSHSLLSVAYFRDGADSLPAYITGCLLVVGLTAFPVAIVVFGASVMAGQSFGLGAGWLLLAVVTAGFQFVVAIGLAVFQVQGQAFRFGTTQAGLAAGSVALGLVLVVFLHGGWEGRALGQIGAAAVAALAVITVFASSGRLRFSGASEAMKACVRFGLPLVPHAFAAALMASMDRLFLAKFSGPAEAGVYFSAFQIASVLTVASGALNQAWIPWLYAHLTENTDAARLKVVKVTYIIGGMLLFFAMALAWGAPLIVPALLGDAFYGAGPLLRWLAPAAAISGFYYFVASYLFYFQRTGMLSFVTVGAVLFQAVLLFLVVPTHGARGAAISLLVANGIYVLCIWIAADRVCPMPWRMRLMSRGV
jgi:O-antigen/teichoic acid export membrane protein